VQEQASADHCKQCRENEGDDDRGSRQGDAERGTRREDDRESNTNKQ